jgi:signal transduction histidine kinase
MTRSPKREDVPGLCATAQRDPGGAAQLQVLRNLEDPDIICTSVQVHAGGEEQARAPLLHARRQRHAAHVARAQLREIHRSARMDGTALAGERTVNTNPEDATPERVSTNDSLKAERDKTDVELDTRQKNAKVEAVRVLDLARNQADDVVQAARAQVDGQSGVTPREKAALKDSRAQEDGILQAERARADATRVAELAERKRALDNLLRLEREGTDDDLLLERARADEAVSTRDVLLAMVSHDLRNMLGSVALNAETLVRDSPEDQPQLAPFRARAQRIQRSAARMNRLVGDLLDVAAVEEGKMLVHRSPHDMLALLEEAVELFKGAALARGIELQLFSNGAVTAPLDHDRIIQVLGNLLGNAIKFTPRGGRVAVELVSAENEVRVLVKDTGPGVAQESLESMFGRFSQVGNTQRSGLGLGLYISRCIVEGHGGHIWAHSKDGEGTTLIFTLPAS